MHNPVFLFHELSRIQNSLLSTLLIVLGLLLSCASDKSFEDSQMDEYKHLDWEGYTLAYLAGGDVGKTIIYFIHGAPGNAKNFSKIYENAYFQKGYRLLSLDRPGYGKSVPKKALTSIEKQADAAAALLKQEKTGEEKVIVVSWSYGCPIAATMEAKYPELADTHLFIAGGFDPDNERFYWFNKPLQTRFLSAIMPKAIIVANKEKMSHVEELKANYQKWSILDGMIYIVHGINDKLVVKANSEFFYNLIINNSKTHFDLIPDVGHLIPMKNEDIVIERIRFIEEKLTFP